MANEAQTVADIDDDLAEPAVADDPVDAFEDDPPPPFSDRPTDAFVDESIGDDEEPVDPTEDAISHHADDHH